MTTPRRYAEGTSVGIDRTISEIQKLVKAHKATSWRYEEVDDVTPAYRTISFVLQGRLIRFTVEEAPLSEFKRTPTGLLRTDASMVKVADEENRRRWRAVLLYVKASIEAMYSGVPQLRHALLPYVVMEDDESVGDKVEAQFAEQERRREIHMLPPVIVEEA